MTYDVKEKSVSSGAPMECYEIVSNFGTWLYTDSDTPITVAGKLFLPLNIARSDIETGSTLDTITTVDVMLPADNKFALLYCFLTSPTDVAIKIYRVHRGDDFSTDYKIIWNGKAVGSSVEGSIAKIKTGSIIQDGLAGSVGTIVYQRSCNHSLYDARCKVNKALFTVAATVTRVRGALVTVDSDGSGNTTLKGGQITCDRTGEFHGIMDNVDEVISVAVPFIDLVVGDTVKLIHGCNHSRLGDCKNKFNNVANYGGMDFIPTVNPFTDLKKQNEAMITTRVTQKLSDARFMPWHWEKV